MEQSCVYVCWLYANSLYGPFAGLTAFALWCFSPYILGHGATIMCDVPAAAMGLAAMYCFLRWLKRPLWIEAIVAGTVLGLSVLCKFTLLVFYPLLPMVWIVYRLHEWNMRGSGWLRQGTMLIAALLISIYVINIGYVFEDTLAPLESFRFHTTLFSGHDSLADIPPGGANRFVGTWLGRLPVPLPANFVQGIDTQRYDFEKGLPSYLRGHWAGHGWWYYYLYALAIKVPLATWLLVVLAVGMTVSDVFRMRHKPPSAPAPLPRAGGGNRSALWRDEVVVLVPGLVILIFVSSQTGFSVHSRYVIPALPFLLVWTSKVGCVFEEKKTQRAQWREGAEGRLRFAPCRLWAGLFSVGTMRVLVIFALAWSVESSLWAYPHSLSYFNELVGGPKHGGEHLLESNIDWGQDLFYLKDWLDGHRAVKLGGLAYWGSYPATLAEVPQTPYPPTGPAAEEERAGHSDSTAEGGRAAEQLGPKPGWYALSVNYLYGRDHQYRYFLNFQPVAMAGYSIYIYHITIDEANRVRRELGMPELRQ